MEREIGMLEEQYIDYNFSSEEFESKYTYLGKDLGATWSVEATTFRIWAPVAEQCHVIGYKEGEVSSKEVLFKVGMKRGEKGTWSITILGNLEGVYYTYQVVVNGESVEACDPYAKAVGINGKRAMVLNMERCNPPGWEKDCNPNKELTSTDAVIYEMHIRDFSSDQHSGIQNKGTFVGVTEVGTVNSYGQSTGLDYLKDLGITHVHLLPVYDYGSIDESVRNETYNWGYDPVNYNVPEGSYSTNAWDGEVRVREMKEMVQTLHNNGISVVMDVVYNHVYDAQTFCMNQIVPGYFSRRDEEGRYSNGSYCGNDTASERSMVHQYIVQSILYWMEEYHMDGFRFDLVGLLDIKVMNAIVEQVHRVRPDVIFYGEGWDMPTGMTKDHYKLAIQMNAQLTPGLAYFNDSMRDLLKGSYSKETERGYINGAKGKVEALKANIMGLPYWSPAPAQTVQYVSCHDDFGIFDRLKVACPGETLETLAAYNRLAAAVVFLSQGIPFVHAGEEFLRSKQDKDGNLISNSYMEPDEVNSIKWNELHDPVHAGVREYYKGLIAFRKAHPAFRLRTASEVREAIRFLGDTSGESIAYRIEAKDIQGEEASQILVIFNPETSPISLSLPEGEWKIYIRENQAGIRILGTANGRVAIPEISTMVLVK